MRLFIAIDVNPEVNNYLLEIQHKLNYAKLRLVKSFHLTLKFLGDANPDKIIEKLEKIKFSKFELKTTNIGVFPNENYVKVMWIGLSNNEQLLKLQKDIEACFNNTKYKFHPHLTLARVAFIKDKEKFQQILNLKTETKKFQVDKFILYESQLTQQGPIYKKVREFSASQN